MHHYSPRRGNRRGISHRSQIILNTVLAIAILLQILYPLTHGETLRIITLSTIYWGAAAMYLHALLAFGPRYANTYLAIVLTFGLSLEILGLHTGWPFGEYSYSPSLGAQVFGVPIVVPFAWAMIAHPTLCAARRISNSWAFFIGGFGLMAYDLFLDPLMVSAGRWKWNFTGSHVPFTPDVPLSNTFGWLLAGMALIAILQVSVPLERRKNGTSFFAVNFFLAWTWFAGVVSNLFFFNRPGLALFAGIAYGAFVAPYLLSRWLGRP